MVFVFVFVWERRGASVLERVDGEDRCIGSKAVLIAAVCCAGSTNK